MRAEPAQLFAEFERRAEERHWWMMPAAKRIKAWRIADERNGEPWDE